MNSLIRHRVPTISGNHPAFCPLDAGTAILRRQDAYTPFLSVELLTLEWSFEKAKNVLSYTALNRLGVNNISCLYKDVGMYSFGRAMSSKVLLPQCFFTFFCLSHNSCFMLP